MGGCAVQNQAAFCYCPNAYYGYYCQHRSYFSLCYSEKHTFGSMMKTFFAERTARSLAAKACNQTCLNGGQCYVDERGQQRCSCSNEFYGERCELSM